MQLAHLKAINSKANDLIRTYGSNRKKMSKNLKKTIVISGINMVEGGILSIMSDCLKYLDTHLYHDYTIFALVHDKALFNTEHIHYIEYKDSKSSWLKRIRYEYLYFKKLSNDLKPCLWLSLHDMSPNVEAQVKAVYCHNATPFYKPDIRTLLLEPKLVAFSAFYKYLYKINIQKNDYVIVQQKWIRQEFKKLFGLNNVVVAYPTAGSNRETEKLGSTKAALRKDDAELHKFFFYPSFPRVFKNFEAVLEASRMLHQKGYRNYKVIITIAGNENKYAAQLYSQYKNDPHIVWSGLLPREEIFRIYDRADCLLFPSRLESWGLPISEFRSFNKPMILADLPYARETAEGYNQARFVDLDNANGLAEAMEELLNDRLRFNPILKKDAHNSELNVNGWGELFDVLLKNK